MKTVDELMALAYKLRDAHISDWDVSDAVAADKALRSALQDLFDQLDIQAGSIEAMQAANQRLAASRDAYQAEADRLAGKLKALETVRAQPVAQPLTEREGLLGEIIGCFDAAIAEGLYEAIAETTDERLKDLLERRVLHAYLAAIGPDVAQPVAQPSDEALLRQALKAMDAAHVTCQSIHHNRRDQGHELGMCQPLERYRLAAEDIRARLEGGV